jgi:hypothetical protein
VKPAELERLRKLARVVEERGATPAEARAAKRVLERLLKRNGLTRADLETGRTQRGSLPAWPFMGWPWDPT